MQANCPRIVIAGTNSGVGKTSLSLGLTAALTKRGLHVQTFKVGPDYLDPSYLAKASGKPCYNLDGWMMGKDYVRKLFARISTSADIAIIEGVMGLFDGATPHDSSGSTAQIARWLDAPVILVVNAHGMARSLAALVKGYTNFEQELNLTGIIANQCGAERHAAYLQETLKASVCPPLLGAVPRNSLPVLPSRHLGLVTANTSNLAQSRLRELADAAEKYISLEQLLNCAQQASPLSTCSESLPERKSSVCLGVAFDEAFHFYYQDLFDELQIRNCNVVRFSPLHDNKLPEGINAIYLGGGYPEEYAAALSSNQTMLNSIKKFIAQGHPVYGECGGLIYLSKGIRTEDNKQHTFINHLPVWTRMLKRRKALGYVEITLSKNSLLGKKGLKIRGHEFHYSELESKPDLSNGWWQVYTVKKPNSDKYFEEGFQSGKVLASYVHSHLPSRPEALEHFLNQCGSSK